jgi:Flp pilus assembly pilin Flp
MVEYGLIISVVALIVVGALALYGESIRAFIAGISDYLKMTLSKFLFHDIYSR